MLGLMWVSSSPTERGRWPIFIKMCQCQCLSLSLMVTAGILMTNFLENRVYPTSPPPPTPLLCFCVCVCVSLSLSLTKAREGNVWHRCDLFQAEIDFLTGPGTIFPVSIKYLSVGQAGEMQHLHRYSNDRATSVRSDAPVKRVNPAGRFEPSFVPTEFTASTPSTPALGWSRSRPKNATDMVHVGSSPA